MVLSRRARFRPCIDLHNGVVKQIVGATLTSANNDDNLVTNFVSEKTAKDFALLYAKDKLLGGHVIKLGAGCDDQALSALRAYPGGLQVGGGITSENALDFLNAGASHVIVTSFVFNNGAISWERLKSLVEVCGKERIVLDLSCRKKTDGFYYVVTNKWQTFTDFRLTRDNLHTLSAYCDEFLVHGVDMEGLRLGIIDELVELLARIAQIPVTYAGGVRDLADLDRVQSIGSGKVDVTVGSALDCFGGDLSYESVVSWSNKNQEPNGN